MTCRFLFFALFLVLVPRPGVAASATTLDEVLAELQRLASTVQTLDSDFHQEKYLSVFKDMLPADGRFYYRRPDCLRWELTSPMSTGFVLKGERGRRWRDGGGKDESFDIARHPVMGIVARQLLAWTQADFDRLRRDFEIGLIDRTPVVLRLIPKKGLADGFLDHLVIAFAPGGRHVHRVEVHEQGGDFTRITFHTTRVNEPLSDNLFDPS